MAMLTVNERAEFTNHLVRFLKSAQRAGVMDVPSHQLASAWMSGIRKPIWMEERLRKDLSFAVEAEEFISRYTRAIDHYEERSEIALQLEPPTVRADAEALLLGVLAATGQNAQPMVSAMSDRELFVAIDQAFHRDDDAKSPEDEWARVRGDM